MPIGTGSLTSDVTAKEDGGVWSLENTVEVLYWYYSDGEFSPAGQYYPSWLFHFSSPITAGSTINSAVLTLTVDATSGTEKVRLAVQNSASPTQPSGDGSNVVGKINLLSGDLSITESSPGQPQAFTITSLIQSLINSVGAVSDILLIGTTPVNPADIGVSVMSFVSKEGSGAIPSLVINWTAASAAFIPKITVL